MTEINHNKAPAMDAAGEITMHEPMQRACQITELPCSRECPPGCTCVLDTDAKPPTLREICDGAPSKNSDVMVPVAALQKVLDDAERMTDALETIALAGMSPSPEMSDNDVDAWHARQARTFIGIAARGLAAIKGTS
jgi:hypothetical protein